MDIQNTMEFILEQLAHVAVLHAKAEERQAEAEERQAKAEERQAKAEERQAKAEEHQERMDRRLSRAIRLAVAEARRERARRRELEDRIEIAITRLAAAQLVTEEKLQRFLEWRSGTNGKG
jgi:hypothetical protein